MHIHAAVAIEGSDAPKLFQTVCVGSDLDEPDGRKTCGLAGLGL